MAYVIYPLAKCKLEEDLSGALFEGIDNQKSLTTLTLAGSSLVKDIVIA